jgi:hypothetical protein
MNVHFMSKTVIWETPQDTFNDLNEEFNLEVDVCALPENAKLSTYFTPEANGLAQDWRGKRCWMNPPYGREIGKWIEKAAIGGGRGGRKFITRPYRYKVVSQIYLRQSGNQIYQRSLEVRRIEELGSVPKYDCNF